MLKGFPQLTKEFGLFDTLLVDAVHSIVFFIADVGLKNSKVAIFNRKF